MAHDELEVRKLLLIYDSTQSEERTCQSATASSLCLAGGSNSYAGNVDPFADLAPGRSPIRRRRTLPVPIRTFKGSKTV